MKQKQILQTRQKQIQKVYHIVKGAPISKAKAQVYGEELDRITEITGNLKAADVVEAARSRNNPLHNYFNWDDEEAAEKFRLDQARLLIRSITVVVRYNNKTQDQRAFFSIQQTPDKKNKQTAYVTIERALSEPELRAQVIANALSELEYWEQKYSTYKELAVIFKAINGAKSKVKI